MMFFIHDKKNNSVKELPPETINDQYKKSSINMLTQ